jgi:hypothetical protein
LKEKINENEQLRSNIDVLYHNNKELQDINIRLYDQIEKNRSSSFTESAKKKTTKSNND